MIHVNLNPDEEIDAPFICDIEASVINQFNDFKGSLTLVHDFICAN